MRANLFDDFRTKARAVKLPREVTENVMGESARLRAQSNAARTGRGGAAAAVSSSGDADGRVGVVSRDAPRRPRIVARLAIAAACVTALLVGVGFLGAPDLSSLPFLPTAGGDFMLKAYAEGIQQEDGTVLALGDFGHDQGWSGGDGSTFETSVGLNLEVVASGVRSVSYELESDELNVGEDIYLEQISSDAGADSGETPAAGRTEGIVVYGPDKEGQLGRTFKVGVVCKREGELGEAYEGLVASSAWEPGTMPTEEEAEAYVRASNRVTVVAQKVIANRLSRTTLVVTVEYEDGGTRTHRYVIAPIEGFGETYADWLETMVGTEVGWMTGELTPEDGARYEELRKDAPQLYTIRELS